MKELDFLKIISNTLENNKFLGDDCAFLKDFDIFVTQDTLVENVHFSMYTTTPYLLGRKSVSVNLSDLAAALSLPLYICVSISLPENIKDDFVKELYRGINDVCKEYNVIVIGGDITSSDKIVVSITAIGKRVCNFVTSRKNAKKDDYILVTGEFGSSGAGLYALSNFLYADKNILDAHLNPVPRVKEALLLANCVNSNIALMDASDGLVDALYKIAQNSKRTLKININDVPVNQSVIDFSNQNKLDYKHFIKWGAEDYELVLCVSEDIYLKLDKNLFTCIGRVQNKDNNPCVIIQDGASNETVNENVFEKYSFNHFKM